MVVDLIGSSTSEALRNMTPLQKELAECLRKTAIETGDRRVVYESEWLGYLPFGLYCWLTVGSKDVSLACPDGWGRTDLEALADAGVLIRVSHWVNPEYDDHEQWQYDLSTDKAQKQFPDNCD